MRSRVTLIGASGFLGRTLLPALLEAGCGVVGVGRSMPLSWPGEAAFRRCDAADPAALRRAVAAADAVINAASAWRDSVPIAENLAELVRFGAIGQVVQISSLAVYGQLCGTFDEAAAPLPARGHRYAQAKLDAEAVLGAVAGGAHVTLLRPGCLYGPGAPVWVDRLARLLWAGRLGDLGDQGDGACPFLHVDDLARIIVRCLNAPLAAAGVHNLPGATALRWNDLFSRLGRLIDAPPLRIGRVRLAADTWVRSPLSIGLARIGGGAADPITPAMRRLFRSRAEIASCRVPLLSAADMAPLAPCLEQAAEDFLRRHSGRAPGRRSLAAIA